MGDNLFCLEQLEDQVKSYSKRKSLSQDEVVQLALDAVSCFIQFARDTKSQFEKLNSERPAGFRPWFVNLVLPRLTVSVIWAILAGIAAWIVYMNNIAQQVLQKGGG